MCPLSTSLTSFPSCCAPSSALDPLCCTKRRLGMGPQVLPLCPLLGGRFSSGCGFPPATSSVLLGGLGGNLNFSLYWHLGAQGLARCVNVFSISKNPAGPPLWAAPLPSPSCSRGSTTSAPPLSEMPPGPRLPHGLCSATELPGAKRLPAGFRLAPANTTPAPRPHPYLGLHATVSAPA